MSAHDVDGAYRRTWRAWALYDVGNSAFFLTIVTAIFPLFFQEVFVQANSAPGTLPGVEETASLKRAAGARLAFAAGIAMGCVALLGPILGALADRAIGKKKLLAVSALLGSLASAGLALIGPAQTDLALGLYMIGTISVASSIVFYDALLPTVARPGDMDRVSSLGFAWGYAGSMILFLLNLVWVLKPGWFGLASSTAGMRLSFVSVGVWWFAFTLPLLRRVREPEAGNGARRGNPVLESFAQLGRTLKDLAGRKQLLLFLAAFWLYSDGIGTIIKLASSFGDQLSIPAAHILLALILTQLVGIPCAIGFGRLAGRTGAKAAITLGLIVYTGICCVGFFLREIWHFYALAVLVGTVQGGTQALSRSLFASMIPKSRSGEYFGFFSTMEKFAGVIGPLLLGLFWAGSDNPRPGILALAAFFILGIALLSRVDVAAARRAAEAE